MKKQTSILLALFTATYAFAAGNATVTCQKQVMTTYPYSDPNPVARPENLIYPYFLFDGYSAKPEQKEWQTVTLENDYLRITIFPEIGGKVWGAFDKVNNREFIYTNDAVKFRNIAMRGPWTSGGIEFNFGIIGHEPTTSSPVDYKTQENADGSVSCFVGSYDLMTRNYWMVEVRLPADCAYFTTSATIYNASSIDQPYYQWMNAAFPAQNNPQFTYPGTAYIGHGGDAHPFPYDEEGRPISWYDRNNFGSSKSYHVIGCLSDYFGIYWHGIDYGSIHHSNYDDKLGQKIFLWSLSRDGGIWENLLTDHHQQYIEMQSGRMYNQPQVESGHTPFKNNAIAAQTTDSWTEYWFPVKGTQGISQVSPIGGLHVSRQGEDIVLRFSPLSKLDTKVNIYNGKILVKSLDINAEPLKLWTSVLTGLDIPEGQLKIVIGNHDLVWSEAPSDIELSRPKSLPKDFNWESAYGLYISGEQLMNSMQYPKAEETLRKSLEKDPYFAPALIRLASLYLHQAKYQAALTLLKTVLNLDAYSAEGNYLYGLCNLALGNMTDAKDGFSLASRSNEFRTAAYEKLGEIFFREGNLAKALHYAEASLQYNTRNLNTLQLSCNLYRALGMNDDARKSAERMLVIAPLYPASRYEAVKSGISSLEDFTKAETCEMPQETYMELASWYESIGQLDDADLLYSLSDKSPIAAIHQAYIAEQRSDVAKVQEHISNALSMNPDFVFPFRVEDKPALEFAVRNSNDWKPRYYLAELLLSLQDHDEAMKLLNECGNPDFAPFWLLYASEASGNERLSALKKAEAIDPSWRVGRDLLKYYDEQSDYADMVKTGEQYHRRYRDNYAISLLLAKAYMKSGKNQESLRLLRSTNVLPYEGASEGYVVYRQANLQEAAKCLKSGNAKKAQQYIDAAKQYPENLGVGKPFEVHLSTNGLSEEDKNLLKPYLE